ncbi:hypothetical protein HMPREF1051_0626 [Neisseria sicca VK64]|uniref:Uncharacterized protein n=1 Tax=Neisseria sicca VK64 TaxID=1095748 RepID=I2NRL3_NEISI|nr:hypothetical protein HMPREF1051_0626 [Neisseria sicca VK64]
MRMFMDGVLVSIMKGRLKSGLYFQTALFHTAATSSISG